MFRREPLWQVSMNVKVNNAVRFTYEAEENAIRLVLKEPVEGQLANSSKEQQLEVVVYALKVSTVPLSKEGSHPGTRVLTNPLRFSLAGRARNKTSRTLRSP